MKQIYNPYLPLTEYVPDGEPHVFDGRVYIYGSHDKANGKVYCEQDYVTWSAPVDDLSDWRYEGVIYRKEQDPSNKDGEMQLWAPDVTKGVDGRYYLYYCFSFYPEIGVAVSDSPAGPFEFYGHVKYPENIRNGAVLKEDMPFDPAVLTDEDGRVYLYYGFAPSCEKEMEPPQIDEETMKTLPEDVRKKIETIKKIKFGENSMVVELEADMLTVKEPPKACVPGGHHAEGTGFEGHAFFEASSIRKFGDTYYFVYSSHKSHELCYATSKKPTEGFQYGGTIVSNGDVGYQGRKEPINVLGNNHGGIEKIGDDYYIFYHRQTNGTECSRQGCAEKINILPDGSIQQVEITSCGLNGEPLTASGIYPAGIACHVTDATTQESIDYDNPVMQKQTRITEKQNQVYVTDITDGSVVGYKYFSGEFSEIFVELRGDFKGKLEILADLEGNQVLGDVELSLEEENWKVYKVPCQKREGKTAIYFRFTGKGKADMKNFGFCE